jgi:isopenicillin-N N-acyltransferase like protein
MIRTRLLLCLPGLVLAAVAAAFPQSSAPTPVPAPVSAHASAAPFHFPTGTTEHGRLSYRNGLPVLVVDGSPRDLGLAVGRLALKPAPRAAAYPHDILASFGAEMLWKVAVSGGTKMLKQFPPDYLAELDAMAEGSGADRDSIIVGNTLFDLKKIFACSGVVVDADHSSTGGPLLGRNLDYPSLGYLHQHSLVTVYHPQGKHAFVSVGFPGLVGCLSGMNDAGLCLAILEVFDAHKGEQTFDAQGVPYALCYRKMLEECTTIAEARKVLTSLRRTSLTNLVVADRQGVAVFEISPGHVEERAPEAGLAACTNHFCTPALQRVGGMNPNYSFERYQSLRSTLADKTKVGPEDLHTHLDAVNMGELTLQTMVFDPKNLRLYLAVGERPASAGAFRTLDLGPLLRGDSK